MRLLTFPKARTWVFPEASKLELLDPHSGTFWGQKGPGPLFILNYVPFTLKRAHKIKYISHPTHLDLPICESQEQLHLIRPSLSGCVFSMSPAPSPCLVAAGHATCMCSEKMKSKYTKHLSLCARHTCGAHRNDWDLGKFWGHTWSPGCRMSQEVSLRWPMLGFICTENYVKC